MKTRVIMLDVLRGLAMFFIVGGDVLVLSLCHCFPGAVASEIQRQFGHAAWDGFRFYDLIFPTFLLISGASYTFGARRWRPLVVRTLILIALGIFYNGALACESWGDIRLPSVLARIGLGVFLAAIPYALLKPSARPYFFPVGLVAYGLLFSLCGGYAQADSWAGKIDALLIPNAQGLDPEGVVSTLGAVLTAYLGMLLGDFLRSPVARKPLWIGGVGAALIGLAYLAAPWCPVIKKLWTSSFVCLAGGWTLVLAAVFLYLTERFAVARLLCAPFIFIGCHALWFYLLPHVFNFDSAAWHLISLPARSLTTHLPTLQCLQALANVSLLYFVVWFIQAHRAKKETKR